MALPTMLDIGGHGQSFPSDMSLVSSHGWFVGDLIGEEYIPNHVERSLALLIEQFEQVSPDLNSLAAAFIQPFQEEEKVLYDLKTQRGIDTASGSQLDMIGEIVGEDRGGRGDDDYRAALRVRPVLNSSHGEPETIILFVKTYLGATTMSYAESYPAAMFIHVATLNPIPSNLRTQIEKISPAGVALSVTYIDEQEPAFAFDGEDGLPPYSNTEGFGEYNYTEGGEPVGGLFVEHLP